MQNNDIVTLKLGEKDYTLKLGYKGLKKMTSKFGLSMSSINGENIDITDVAKVLYCAIQFNENVLEISFETFEDLLDKNELSTILEKIEELMTASFGKNAPGAVVKK
jgi:hypothetical protein